MEYTVEPLSNPDTNGAEEVSLLVRCPRFRGRNACKSGTWGGKCVLFRDVLSSGVFNREVPLYFAPVSYVEKGLFTVLTTPQTESLPSLQFSAYNQNCVGFSAQVFA